MKPSWDQIVDEIRALEKDLLALNQSRHVLLQRIRTLESEGDAVRVDMFSKWPPYQVIENGFIIAIVRCEGLIDDYREMLKSLEPPAVARIVL
jgi:hypothetical protein